MKYITDWMAMTVLDVSVSPAKPLRNSNPKYTWSYGWLGRHIGPTQQQMRTLHHLILYYCPTVASGTAAGPPFRDRTQEAGGRVDENGTCSSWDERG